ncbi:MAG: hypothetical protein QM808_17735 [Steroidobacteraceae bacterium]
MPETVTNELIYEILKKIQEQGADTNRRVMDLEEQMKGTRHLLVSMQSDDLRYDAAISALRADMSQIKNRLNLADA